MPRLLVDISAHGFGHLGQTGPVVNALHAALPDLQIVVRSGLSQARLASRIEVPFAHVQAATDFGYVMHNAIDLDLPATARRYRDFHADWPARVAAEAAWIAAAGFDAVLSNVAYLPLAGAAQAGVPSAAMCSLNWADLFAEHFGNAAWAAPIHHQMLAAYRGADAFLRITPGLPMAALENRRIIGPVCRLRSANRAAIAAQLQIDVADQWLLVAMGGIDFALDIASWPVRDGFRYLVPQHLAASGPNVTVFNSERIDFTMLLASVDAVLTKPGYGTFAEAACHGIPVLYVPRGDWAEEEFLIAWLEANTRALAIDRERFMRGALGAALDTLWALPARPRPQPAGIAAAVDILAELFGADRRAKPRPAD